MSASLNKVMLIGRLGNDVQSHKFADGNSVVNFSLATSESYIKKDSGEKIEKTEWHRIVAKNKLAEICEKYLSKGDLVYVEGKLQSRSWEDNGNTKYVTEVFITKVDFLSTKASNDNTPEWQVNEDDLPY